MTNSSDLNFNALADLPQTAFLKEVVTRLTNYPEIIAIWLGGSLASHSADEHSDLDLRIAIPSSAFSDWQTPNFKEIFGVEALSHSTLKFSETGMLHHLLVANGIIVDLYIQTREQTLTNEQRHIFICKDDTFKQKLLEPVKPYGNTVFPEANAKGIQDILSFYWLNAHKFKKGFARDLDVVIAEGLSIFRPSLLRLHYIALTGHDCGNIKGVSIHGMTPISKTLQAAKDKRFLTTIGLASSTRADKIKAVTELNDRVAELGRALAKTYDFDYPEALERLVQDSWHDFVAKSS